MWWDTKMKKKTREEGKVRREELGSLGALQYYVPKKWDKKKIMVESNTVLNRQKEKINYDWEEDIANFDCLSTFTGEVTCGSRL